MLNPRRSIGFRLILSFLGVVLLLSVLSTLFQQKLVSSSLHNLQMQRVQEEKKRLDTFLEKQREELYNKALSSASDATLIALVKERNRNVIQQKLKLLRRALSLDVLGVVFPKEGIMVFSIEKNVAPVDTPSDIRFQKALLGARPFFTMITNLGLEMRQVTAIGHPPEAVLVAGRSLQENFVKGQKELFGMDTAVLYEADVLAHTFPFDFRYFPSSILFTMKKFQGTTAHLFTTTLRNDEPYYVLVKPMYKEERGSRQGYLALFISRKESLLARKRALRQMAGVGFLAFVVALVFSVVLARGLVRPVVHLARQAEKIAKGELKEVEVARRQDEIGNLNLALYTMTSTLQDIIALQSQKVNEILRVVKQAGSGDLTQELDDSGESAFSSLSAGLNQMMHSLIHILKNLTAVATSLRQQAGTLLSLSTQQMATMNAQNEKAVDVASSTEENAASLRQLTEVARKLKEISTSMQQLSKKGEASLGTVSERMQGIREKAALTRERMDALDTLSNTIGEFVGNIEDIAHKIHLLSLNAAIEAARAGEAGRGFSVVAQEVRTLSASTGKFAQQIKELVEKIQKESHETKRVSEDEVAAIGQGEEAMHQMAQVLQELLSRIGSCDELSSQIHLATQEGQTGAERITQKMREMEEGVREAKEAAATLRRQAESLSELAEKLHQTASGFQLP